MRSFWVVQVLGSLIGFVIGFELYIVVGYRTDLGSQAIHVGGTMG